MRPRFSEDVALQSSVPTAVRKEYLYALGGGRLLYTFASLHTEKPLRRCAAQILLALSQEPFRLTVNGAIGHYHAAVIKPRAPRTCKIAAGINVQIDPSHPQFRRFRTIGASGVLAMNRDTFREFDADFYRAYDGRLTIDAATSLADTILNMVLSRVSEVRPLDVRIARVIDLLKANPKHSLHELATVVGISYHRLSHLFMAEMGIPLRTFHLWRKVHSAMQMLGEMSIVDAAQRAGFADRSHLSHAFQQLHTWTPSYFYDSNRVKIIARPRSRRDCDVKLGAGVPS